MRIFKREGKLKKSYVLDYYVKIHGVLKRREESFPTKKLAELAMAKRKVEIAEDRFLDKKRKPEIGFDEMVERYLEWARGHKVSWDRDKLSLSHWQVEFKGKTLSEICKLDIERYKLRRKEEVAPRTVNEEINCLRRFFYRAMEWGLAESNPVRGVKRLREPPGRIKVLSPEEEKRLLDACTLHLRPVVLTALHTGMRRGEILRLTWNDIDFKRNVIVVRDSKNGESREIPMSGTLRKTLSGLSRRSEFVFTSNKGKPFKCIRNVFQQAVKKAGLVDFHFHDCRHVCASKLRIRGVEITDIKEILGHKTLAMTLRYAHIASKRKQDIMKLLDRGILESSPKEAKVVSIDKPS